jgi:uncharacterized membrane protein
MRRHVVFAAAAGIGLLATMAELAAGADRYEFRVVGVRSSDALNIRARIESQQQISDAEVLGRIPARSTGIVGTGASQKVGPTRWYEVRYGNVLGWVNGKYLEPLSPDVNDALASNLFCAGAGPAWSMKIEDDRAEVHHADEKPERYSVSVREPFQGRSDVLALQLTSDNAPEISALIQHKEWCQDGLSNLEYAFEVRMVGLRGEERPLRGCCSLLR